MNLKKYPIGVFNKNCYGKLIKKVIDLNGGMCLNEIRTNRLNNLKNAILRYAEAELNIDTKWVQEYNNLLKELKKVNAEFKL